jgi:hypothetical protein
MNTITKSDFLQMVRLDHLEVLTQEQLGRNTQILKTYIEKALTSDLSDIEKGDADVMIDDVASLQQWCVLRDDFSKAIVYTRREQIAWDEPQRGEFGEILKARGGVYKPTPENKKLGRIGQKYGEVSHEEKEDVKGLREHSAKIGKKIEENKKHPKLVPVDDDRNKVTKIGNVEIHEVNKPESHKTDKVAEHYREATKGQGKSISLAETDKLHQLCEYSKKPYTVDDIEQTKITDEIRKITDKLPVIEQTANFLQGNCPKEAKGKPYIAEVKGSRFLCDPQGYDYPRYITKLVSKITPVE